MRRMTLVAAVIFGLGSSAAADKPSNRQAPNQPATPAVRRRAGDPQLRFEPLGRCHKTARRIDAGIKQTPPPSRSDHAGHSAAGEPGGNPAVKPK